MNIDSWDSSNYEFFLDNIFVFYLYVQYYLEIFDVFQDYFMDT